MIGLGSFNFVRGVLHMSGPLVTSAMDYRDPRSTGGIDRQTCRSITQLSLMIEPLITKG